MVRRKPLAKRAGFCLLVWAFALVLAGCLAKKDWLFCSQPNTILNDETAVTQIIETFGHRLKDVSLLASSETLEDDMLKSFGDLVSPTLISGWVAEPLKAPGRATSSPWPVGSRFKGPNS